MNAPTARLGAALAGLAVLAGGLVLILLLAGTGATAAGAPRASAAAHAKPFKLPKVRHVFVIVLENEDYASTFGEPSADPYLARTLPSEGALLSEYFATGHESNDNYIALVSGQPPNPENQADCQLYDNLTAASEESDGVEAGIGCVYPANVANIGTPS
jgi:hypothetical protein